MAKEFLAIGKLENLLRDSDLNVTQFVALCAAYNIQMTNAMISQALKTGTFNSHETDEMLRPLIMRLQDLVERMKPLRLSFANAENTKLILDLIGFGVDVRVGEPISVSNQQ